MARVPWLLVAVLLLRELKQLLLCELVRVRVSVRVSVRVRMVTR